MVAVPRVTGTLALLACPAPLCPHAEFAVASVLEVPVSLQWSAQPAVPGALVASVDWHGPAGTAARLAARLRAVGPVRFEVTEDRSAVSDAERFAFTPELGMHRSTLSAAGEVVLGEGPLQALIARADSAAALATGVERLLGTAWDQELEPLRRGGDGAPVTWLRRTG